MLGDEANKPLVVRLDGNNVDEGHRILDEANHPLVTIVDTMDGAADKAAELAQRLRHRNQREQRHGDLPDRAQQGRRPGHDRLARA